MRLIQAAALVALIVPVAACDHQTAPILSEVPQGACLSGWPVDGRLPPEGQAWVVPDGQVIQADIHGLEGERYFQRCEHGTLSRAFREDGTPIQ